MRDRLFLIAGIAAAVVLLIVLGVFLFAGEKKDFFECGPDNTLVVCPVGETPDAATHGDCRAVGDGETTLEEGTCS